MKKSLKINKKLIYLLLMLITFLSLVVYLFKEILPSLIREIYPLLSSFSKGKDNSVVFSWDYYLNPLIIIFLLAFVFVLSYKKFFFPKFSLNDNFPRSIFFLTLFFFSISTVNFPILVWKKYFSLFLMVLSLLFFFFCRDSLFSVRLKKLVNIFTKPMISIPIVISLSMILFFRKFPAHHFNSIIFSEDYPFRFAFLTRGLEVLKQGAIFGWDSKLLGGYPTFFDVNDNYSFIYLPFSIFGLKIGFHLMILFFWLFFSFIIYAFILEAFGNRKVAGLSLYISLVFNLSFLNDLLVYGMIDNYVAINLFISALFFALRFKKAKRGSLTFLLLSLFLLIYTHIGIFFFGLIFVVLELLVPFRKCNFRNFTILITFLFLSTLNYTFYFLIYPSFFNPHTLLFKSAETHLLNNFLPQRLDLKLLNCGNCNIISWVCFIFTPLLIWLVFRGNSLRKYAFYVLLLIFVFHLKFYSAGINNLFHRSVIILPFLLTVIFSSIVISSSEKRNFALLVFIPGILIYLVSSFSPLPHIKNLRDYNPSLISRIEKIQTEPILLESRPHLIEPFLEKCREEVHLEGLISQDLGKSLLSYPLDGYHYSIFRNNALQSGVFRGKPLSEIDVSQFNRFLDKWGVKNMIVWSDIAKGYFNNFPEFYFKEWEDKEWAIFNYKYAPSQKGLKFLQNRGSGELKNLDYFLKILQLSDVKISDTVVLKTNYFPAWKAFYKDREIPVFSYDEQLAIKVPFNGAGKIILRYPKHYFLSFLIFISFVCAILIDWGILMRKTKN